MVEQAKVCVRCNKRRFNTTVDFTRRQPTCVEPTDISKSDIDKCQYVMRQLEGILEADKRRKEAENSKLMQEVEAYKVQLKDSMKSKFKKAKAVLKDISDKETDVTTRLALLQNKQLLAELEYQSKQAEELVAANGRLEKQVAELRREVEIHKQVEIELARQSSVQQQQTAIPNHPKERTAVTKKKATEEKKEASNELILFLESKLEETEKKYIDFQREHQRLYESYMKQQKIVEVMKEKYSKAGSLLVELLDNVLSATPGLLQSEKNFYLDVERL